MPDPTDDAVSVLISREGERWRLYCDGFVAHYVSAKLDEHGEALLKREPDLTELDSYMWGLDAPYRKVPTTLGGVQLEARGLRSVTGLWEWLSDLLEENGT